MNEINWGEVSEGYFDSLEGVLLSSSTSRRRRGLRELYDKIAGSQISQGLYRPILRLVWRTYPIYIDRPSRQAAQQCLRALLRAPMPALDVKYFTQKLQRESLKSSMAPANAFVLMEWCSLLLQHLSDDQNHSMSCVLDVISADAKALETCLRAPTKHGMKHSAVIVTRRALRALFSAKTYGEDVLLDSVLRLTTDLSSASKNIPFLGIISGVCARLPNRKPIMEDLKHKVLALYAKEIIGSRTVVPLHIAGGLHDFFFSFATAEDLQIEVWPALEKAILRAPEVVFSGLIIPLSSSIPEEIDLSEILYSRFSKALLASLKSASADIRNGAVKAFEHLLSRCRVEKWLLKIAEEVLVLLKNQKITNAEHRALHAQILSAIPTSPDVSQTIVSGLPPVCSREASEIVLDSEIKAFCYHLAHLMHSGTPIGIDVSSAITKGCGEKRIAFRKLWLLNMGEFLWGVGGDRQLTQDFTGTFLKTVVIKFQESFDDVATNPLPSVQSGAISIAYVLTALSARKFLPQQSEHGGSLSNHDDIIHKSLTISPKPSFLLNPKVYTKLSSKEDLRWIVRALHAVSRYTELQTTDAAARDAWAQAFIYVICSSGTPPEIRKEATRALTQSYLVNPALIGVTVVNAMWQWLQEIDMANKDSAAVASGTGTENLFLVVNSITHPTKELLASGSSVDSQILSAQLVDLLVLCHPELIPGAEWIDVALRAGVDPGDLVQKYPAECMMQILQYIKDPIRRNVRKGKVAAWHAATDIAFVAPKMMIPRLVRQIEDDLRLDRLKKFGPTDIAIARTAEGTTFVDVLSTKPQQLLSDKSVKDYDTLKWEEELRTQLAQKRGVQQRKLTADEQAKVNAQLSKESDIRKEVQLQEELVKRGAGIIGSLAKSRHIDAEGWINPAVNALLALASAGAGILVGDTVASVYVACGDRVSSRLGNLRPFVGIATLRCLGKTFLSPELEAEPLGELVTRILYRLRLASEQRPFDVISLAYILPLIFIVLGRNGIDEPKEDQGEQVLLALEFLSLHTGSFSDNRLPRAEVLRQLIASMQKYTQHYKTIRDTLHDLCRCVAGNINQEELDILLQGAIVPEASVRTSVLQTILAEIDLTVLDFSEYIWLECHDNVAENAEVAGAIWEENGLEVDENSPGLIMRYLGHADSQLREAASRALAHAVQPSPSLFADTLQQLQSIYREEVKPKAPERDAYGMPRKIDAVDNWKQRSGIALAFKAMAGDFQQNQVVTFMEFLVQEEPLVDPDALVRRQMAESGTALVALKGREKVEELMQLFERTLETSDKATERSDWLNEAVIILYGSLARHLKAGDRRLDAVIRKLLAALPTPSEMVQFAVAECLPPLVRLSDTETATYVQEMLDQLLHSKKYASRRGAAYGLAGIVRGKGICALREYRIMAHLKDALENKKDQNQRHGALLALEVCSLVLGRIFEPYVIQFVPQLLSSFGDSSVDVRDACLHAAKACFASLSSYGVKQILPTLLEGLDDPQWRSKKGACDLLGAMAYLDPQQLAASLPDIIPPLAVVLNDSHKEVRNSANRSLQRFGEVISNPEVKSLVGILLKALSDPTKFTDEALDALIKVSFVHYLDAPSLALVVRILERGLGDRSATKRKAAQIIGSLAHLTERKDLISHLPIIVAGLKLAIVDPVPTTRATASKALGSLVEKLGEDALPDLIPSLMATLKSDTGAGDRLGSAQALSEVLAGLGTTRLEETLPTILQNVSSAKAPVREGFMSLFIFLPACFGNSFASYLSKIIPPILAGLADDIEAIRETSLRAGRLLVKNFATRAIDLLLPELERGLADDSYRIRLSSVELVGDLLFSLTGINSKADVDEEGEGVAQAGQSLLEVLGEDKRNKVLSSLYICRCDTSGLVRSAAIAVWKALVATPRTLKELVPTLSQLIIRRLASSNMEQKVIAGNALGELIKKAGEGVLATLLPSLEEGLITSTDVDARQGICIALRELVTSASTEALESYEKVLISIVRTALIDSDENVREAAADAFDALQQVMGKRSVDQVLPDLLLLLRNEEDAQQALSALLTLLTETTRANMILPNLIPTLLTAPITSFNAKAIASLSEVAGSAMTRRLPTILNSLMDGIISTKDNELRLEISEAFDSVLASVDEFDGLNTAMSVMLSMMKHEDHRRRANAAIHLATFFSVAEIDISRYHPDLIRVLLISFDDRDRNVVRAAWEGLSQLTAHMRKEEMELQVVPTRQVLRQVGVAGADLPGFCLPKGISAVLPIFLQGLLNGNVDQRTQSALAIADIIDRTSVDSLKPFVTQITGPLIRVVSERSVDIKCAVFLALNKLLEKIPLFVKPFVPQLQRTFSRGLADPSSEVLRNRAATGLGILITLTPRIDPLVAELVTGSKTTDAGVKSAMLRALHEVVSKAGANMSETSKQAILGLIDDDSGERNDAMVITNARLLGVLVKNLPVLAAIPLIKNRILTPHLTHLSVLGLNSVIVECPSLLAEKFPAEVPSIVCHGISNSDPFISDNSVLAAGKYLLSESFNRNFETNKPIFEALGPAIQPGRPVDTRRMALVVIRTVSRLYPDLTRPHLALLTPPIFASVRDVVIPVKLAAEAAFLSLFSVVESEGTVFEKYMAGPAAELPVGTKRSMQDYFKRVALRLGNQARERREAEGGQGGLGLSSDELDDEKEVWSVGKLELGDTFRDD